MTSFRINIIGSFLFDEETVSSLREFLTTDAVAIRFNRLPRDTIGNDVALQIREVTVYVVEGDVTPVTSDKGGLSAATIALIVCFTVLGVAAIAILVFLAIKYRRRILAKFRRTRSQDYEEDVAETPKIREPEDDVYELDTVELRQASYLEMTPHPDWFTQSLQLKLRDCMIDPSQLIVHYDSELVHKGKFGAIYKGTCRGVDGRGTQHLI